MIKITIQDYFSLKYLNLVHLGQTKAIQKDIVRQLVSKYFCNLLQTQAEVFFSQIKIYEHFFIHSFQILQDRFYYQQVINRNCRAILEIHFDYLSALNQYHKSIPQSSVYKFQTIYCEKIHNFSLFMKALL